MAIGFIMKQESVISKLICGWYIWLVHFQQFQCRHCQLVGRLLNSVGYIQADAATAV